MTIARGVKYGALIALFIAAYTFVGAMTYRYNERLFPGDGGDGFDDSDVAALLWPIGLPVTLGLHAARLVK